MGKKYLDTKKHSVESSILSVWQEASLKQEKLDAVNKNAVKKKFADRKDKDIDNDGDVDDSDKYLHKRRKAVSKAVKKDKKEEVELGEATAEFLGMQLKDMPLSLAKRFKLKIKPIDADDSMVVGDPKNIEKLLQKLYGNDWKNMYTKDNDGNYIEEKKEEVKEYYEMGTDEYRKHTQGITPGQEIQDYGRLKMQSMKEALAKVWGLDKSESSVKKEKKDLTKELKGGKTLTGKESDTVDVEPKLEKKK